MAHGSDSINGRHGIPIKAARDRPNERFIIQSNSNVRNAKLTGLARAVHAYLISLPEGWAITADQVAEDGFPLDSRQSVRRAFRELRDARLVLLKRVSHGRGSFEQWYETYHDPQPQEDTRIVPTPAVNRAGDTTRENVVFPQVVSDARFTAAENTAAIQKTVTEDCKKTDRGSTPSSPGRTAGSGSRGKPRERDDDTKIRLMWQAEQQVYGAVSTEKEQALRLWAHLIGDRRPRNPVAYLVKIFNDTPSIDSLLTNACTRGCEFCEASRETSRCARCEQPATCATNGLCLSCEMELWPAQRAGAA